MVTMKDIAKLAGVSTATVSRALMKPEQVSDTTRLLVQAAVLESGYSAHSLIKKSRKNESKTVIVVIPNIHDSYFSGIIKGIEEVADKNNYLVLLKNLSDDNKQTAPYSDLSLASTANVQGMIQEPEPQENITEQKSIQQNTLSNLALIKQVDGIILLGSELPFEIDHSDPKDLPPLVMAGEFLSELNIPTIHIDNLTSSFELVNHLTQIGHHKIAQLQGPTSISLCHFRDQGYKQALRRANIQLDLNYQVSGDFSFEFGASGIDQLLALPNPPTAIFCHNDAIAIGAIQQAKKRGLSIPKDLSIVGFDDILFAQYCDPPLTTMSQPSVEIGQNAMQIMLDILNGYDVDSGCRLLDTELIIRKSTAPPSR